MNKIFRKAIVLALAGSALLYTGCTKDYSQEITTLQGELENLKNDTSGQIADLRTQLGNLQQAVATLEQAKQKAEQEIDALKNRATALETFKAEATQKFQTIDGQINGINTHLAALDGQIAAINQNIQDLQAADSALEAAIEAAKTRITDLETAVANVYNKTEVDGKLNEIRAWANETFATKATVAQIDAALGQLAGTVQVIDNRLLAVENTLETLVQDVAGAKDDIVTIKGDIATLRGDLQDVKATAESALGKANQALSETEAIRNDLTANYYTKAEVDAKLQALKAAVDAEIDALKASDVAMNERIDSLAGVTSTIESNLASFQDATNTKLGELEQNLNEEIANRLVAEGLLALAIDNLDEALQAVDAAYKAADVALDERITANANDISDLKTNLDNKYNELKGEIATLKTDLEAEIADLWDRLNLLEDWYDAQADRIQSVVFVPEYGDFRANDTVVMLANKPLKKIVTAEFEIQPVTAIGYIDSLIAENAKGNQGIGLAVKELKSRAVDADRIIYDEVSVSISDEARGRFVIKAFLNPEEFDEEIAIACVLGDYKSDAPLNGNVVYSGNAIQSTYVGTYVADEYDLIGTYRWYDEKAEASLEDSLGVALRIPYTKPAKDSLVFSAVSESLGFRMELATGVYKTLTDVADWLFIDVDDITPEGEEESWETKDADGNPATDNKPFDLSDFAPETSLTTETNADGVVDPEYVHYTTGRKEIFTVNGQTIAPFAFVAVEIVKNVVPAFTTDAFELPWSYVHPDRTPGKAFAVDADSDFGKAISGTYNDADENFTKGGEEYTAGPEEDIIFDGAASQVIFRGWQFEAEDASYVAKTERFETESDDYEIDVPFVMKKKAADRGVKIELGELAGYGPTAGYNSGITAITPAFNGEEEYFIGDAEEPYNCQDSLYSAYAHAMDFQVDSIFVNGEKYEIPAQFVPVVVNISYNVNDVADASTLEITPGWLPYGASVTVYGRYTAFTVNFDYEISFTTPAVPFFLVLTPYGDFDPEKSKTIIVEGDDQFDANGEPTTVDANRRYNIQQMYYTKYMRVQDQDGVPTNLGEDLEVRFSFEYEAFEEFGIELGSDATSGEVEAAEAMRGVFGGVTDAVAVLGDNLAGYLDQSAILTWGTYQGLKVKAFATLYDNGVKVSEALEFSIETMKPIELKSGLTIGTEAEPLIRTSGESIDIRPASAMVVGGILSRDADYQPYYVEDPSVYGYNDNNVRQEGYRQWSGGFIGGQWIYYPAGEIHPFYGPLSNEGEGRIVSELFFDYDNIKAVLNGTEWDLTNGGDWTTSVDDYGEKFTLIKDSGKGNIVLNIPVKFRYYLDYCGAKAQEGIVTVYIRQI